MTTAPPSKTPTQAPDTVFIDELTWEETRDALKAGKTTVIVPTGGPQPDSGGSSEAEIMRDGLVRNGVPPDRVLLDHRRPYR